MNTVIDENDIDDTGHGVGPILGCMHCKATTRTHWWLGSVPYTVALHCAECLEQLVEVAI